jgi:hypothetical protein
MLAASLAAPVTDSTPPVRLWLSSDGTFRPGERARVYVQPAEDGYLVVLRANADGRVRVIYPIDPGDDDFVRGGKKFEIRWRGEREAFYVEELPGQGTVVAVWSPDPFKFDEFVRNGHWDYRVLAAKKLTDDPEAGLVDIAQRMAGGEGTEVKYDAATYVVTVPPAWRDPLYGRGMFGGPWGSGVRLSFLFGTPYYGFGYRPFYYDPFCYDPFWGYDAFACGGYGYGYGYGLGFGGFYRQPIYYVRRPVFVRSFGGVTRSTSRFVIPRDRVHVTPIQPRTRGSTIERAPAPRVRTSDRASGRGGWSRPSFSGRGSSRGAVARSRGGGGGGRSARRH